MINKMTKKISIIALSLLLVLSFVSFGVVAFADANSGSSLFVLSQGVTAQNDYTSTPGEPYGESKGVLITAPKEGDSFSIDKTFSGKFNMEFNGISDGGQFSTDKNLAPNFNELVFTFTDKNDSKNYFKYTLSGKNEWGTNYIKAIAEFKYFKGARNPDSANKINKVGSTVSGSFALNQIKGYCPEITFDPQTMQIIVPGGDRGDYVSIDMDDASMVGIQSVMTGFEEYTVSVQFKGVAANPAKLLVSKINGQSLAGSAIVNNAGPRTFAKNVSDGVINKAYKIPAASAFDVIDGKIPFVGEITVTKDDANIAVSNGSFTPTEAGAYLIKYKAKDSSNTFGDVFTLNVNVIASHPEIKLDVDGFVSEVIASGKTVSLPKAVAKSALSVRYDNLVDCNVIVKKGSDVKLTKNAYEANTFKFDADGAYTVLYVGTDYLGKAKTVTYNVVVKAAPTIALDSNNFTAFLDKNYTLPTAKASLNGTNCDVVTTLIDSKGAAVTLNNNSFVPAVCGRYIISYSTSSNSVTVVDKYYLNVGVDSGNLFESVKHTSFISDKELPSNFVKGSGVSVTSVSEGGIAKYKNSVDIASLDKDTNLMEFSIVSKIQGAADFKTFDIIVADALDESNYFTIRYVFGQWGSEFSYIKAGVGDSKLRALSNDKFIDGKPAILDGDNVGSLAPSSFTNSGIRGAHVNSFKVRYDPTENAVYTEDVSLSNWKVLDFNDAYCVGAGREWNGFTSSLVNISVKFSAMQSSSAEVVIQEIAGQSLSGAHISDNVAPYIDIDMGGNLTVPYGLVGNTYPIPEARAYDIVNGALGQATVKVFDAQKQEMDMVNGKFTPSAAGNYEIVYSAKDLSDNSVTKSITVEAKATLTDFAITLDENVIDSLYVGNSYRVPKVANVVGGSGIITHQTKVTLDGKNVEIDANNEIFISKKGSGAYVVTYTVKDYLERKRDFTFDIAVTANTKPIIEIVGVPEVLIKGKAYALPDFTALLYDDNGDVSSVDKNITVYENESVTGTVLKSDRIYTPTATAKTIRIVYTAGSGATQISKEFLASVISPQQIGEYFVGVGAGKNVSYEYSEGNASIVVNPSTKSKLRFANSLLAHEFLFQFNIDETRNNFAGIRVVLTDALNSKIKVNIDIKKGAVGGKTSKVFINNGTTEYEMPGSFFGTSSDVFELSYNNNSYKIFGFANYEIATISSDSRGFEFNGFPSGKIMLEVELLDVTARGSLELLKVGNQPFYGSFDSNDNILPFEDNMNPIIQVQGDVPKILNINDDLILHRALALDILDPNVTLTVSLSLGKEILIDKQPIDKDIVYKLTKYGTYTVVYEAIDGEGNPRRNRSSVKVDDKIAPVITINGDIANVFKVKTEVVFPQATITDNYFTDVGYEIIVLNPYAVRTVLKADRKYTFNMVGNYTIIYFAKDNDYSVSTKEIDVIVNETGVIENVDDGGNSEESDKEKGGCNSIISTSGAISSIVLCLIVFGLCFVIRAKRNNEN